MLQFRRGVKPVETLVKVPRYELGLGHATRPDPNQLKPGQSLRTYDVNLDRPFSAASRKGSRYLCENPVGGLEITTCEEAIGGAAGQWSAGFVTDDNSVDADGTLHYRPYKLSIVGSKAKRITATGTATNFASFLDLSASPLNLGTDMDEPICFWLYVNDKSKVTHLGFSIRVTLETTANVDLFTYTPVVANLTDKVTDNKPWNFIVARKRDWLKSGVGDWTNIRRVGIKTACNDAGGTFVTFDHFFLAPKQLDGLHEFRQSSRRGGGVFKLAAARGVIAYLDEQLHRWVPLVTDRTPYRPVTFVTFGDFCYASSEGDKVKLLAGDGKGLLTAATCYDAGIAAPVGAVGFVEKPAGLLPAGVHEYRFRFYSDVTGLPGNSTPWSTPATAANVSVHMEPLPGSGDQKVTHLDIYRRDATEGYFKRVARVSSNLRAFDDNVPTLQLGDILEGRPQYKNNDAPPRLSILAAVGNRMLGAGDPDDPAVLYVSRPDNAEQWDLVNAPVRLWSKRYVAITAIFDLGGYACVGMGDPLHIGVPEAGPTGFRFSSVPKADFGAPVSHRGVVATDDNTVRYPGRDGYYYMNRSFRPQKMSRDWDIGPAAPGVVEPYFRMLDRREPQYVCGAYNKSRAQVIWTDKLSREDFRNLMPVLHVGQLETAASQQTLKRAGGSASGWSFHRHAQGHILAGMSALAQYVDDTDGSLHLMGGGMAGLVYQLDTGEIDDVTPNERVLIAADILFPFDGIPGAALGSHQLKDYVYHDIAFEPMTNTPVQLEYSYDWKYLMTADAAAPIGTDIWSPATLPFQVGAIFAELGSYHRIKLEAGRHRNVAWRAYNATLGGAFHISECIWWLEYKGGEGAFD